MVAPLLTLCLLLTGDWPQFRGPQADAHTEHSGLPLKWSDTENVIWKTPIDGLGWSSPVIVGDKVYLTTAVAKGEGLSLRALALKTSSGEIVWDREVKSITQTPKIHSKNSHASPTPIVADGAVYVHFGALGMAKLASEDGKIIWLCEELDYPPMHGSGGSPVLHAGKLFIACDGSQNPFMAAVDAETGKVAWRTPRSVKARINHSFGTATLATVGDQTQVIAPGPDHLAAYDPATGQELWKVVATGWSVVPQPTIGHGMVIYNHDYDNPELIAVKLGGHGDITDSHVVWRVKKGAPSTPSPLLVGDELYIVSDAGIASCLDAKTGKTHWVERIGGNFSSSPVYANGRILILDETGKATWLKPGPNFEILGTNNIPGRTFATPAFQDKAMFIRTDTALYKIENTR
jgi:outer membrane protein assembly factor BamB